MEAARTRSPLALIARGAGIVLAGVLVGSALGYAQKLVVAHHLPPGGLGRVTLGLAVVGLSVALATLGFREGVARYIARHRDEPEVVRGTLRAAFGVALPASVALAYAVHAASDRIALGLFDDPFMGAILRIVAPLIVFQTLAQLAIATFRGFHVAGYKAFVADFLQPVLVVLLLLAFLGAGLGAEGGASAYVIAGAVMAGVALLLLEIMVTPLVRGLRLPARPVARDLVSFSWPLALTGVLWLVVAWTDVTMLGVLRTSFDVGLYGVALPTSQLLLIPLNAVAFLFMPALAALHGRGDVTESRRVYAHVTRWLFIATFPVWLFIVAFAEPLVNALFGVGYAGAATPLRILATGFLVACVVGPTGNALVALGRPRLNLVFAGTAAGLNVVLNLLLIPPFGPTGAALATAASVGVSNAVSLVLVHRVLRAHPFSRGLLAPALAASLALLPFLALSLVAPAPRAVLLLAALITYGALYLGGLVLFRAFHLDDVEVLEEVARDVPALAPPLLAVAVRLRRLAH